MNDNVVDTAGVGDWMADALINEQYAMGGRMGNDNSSKEATDN